MKKHSWKGWSHAICMDCGWELENINAQAVGAKHAKHHKHKVLVTTEIESSYDGRISNKSEDPNSSLTQTPKEKVNKDAK